MSCKQTGATAPTIDEVEKIAAWADPLFRNLLITQCYHELSAALATRLGPSANWCTFATWASKQAGQTIRGEDLERSLAAVLQTPAVIQPLREVVAAVKRLGARSEPGRIEALAWEMVNPAAALQRAAAAVGEGNRKVFAEIGQEFARFLATRGLDADGDANAIDRFCAALQPGDPPHGQRYLQTAFRHYYQAFFTTDIRERAQLIFLANLDIGFHEQTRLQPEIAASLDAGLPDPREVVTRLLNLVFPDSGWLSLGRWVLPRLRGGLTPLTAALDSLLQNTRQQIRQVITEHLMTIGLPHGVRLRLGRDLDRPFPAALQQITLPELQVRLAALDPTPDSPRDSGAVDWAALPDRLHFIIDMFRSYQESPELFEPPFTPEQLADLRAGRLPAGDL